MILEVIFLKKLHIFLIVNLPNKTLKMLKNLDVLIIDCFRKISHATHLDLESTVKIIKILKPKKGILINMHIDLDYDKLKKNLPKNIFPAYDGLSFKF